MSQDTNVENLIINNLTKAQYESIVSPDPTQLYFITDEVISSEDVIAALGYTPYNATNPAGYTSNTGTVTSVNNIQPDANGNVAITIPDTATWGNITGTLADQTDLQQALDGKQPTITGAATTITNNDLTAGRVLISDNSGKVATGSITTAKLEYLSDVTSNIQVQINGKYDASNPAGYISGIDSTDVVNALGFIPYDATNPNNYITASALNGYATETYVNNGLATKQDTLVSGTNIKTINSQSLLDSGNIDIQTLTSGNGINIDDEDNSIDLIQQDVAAAEKYTWSDLTIDSYLVNADNVISGFNNNRYIAMPNEALTVTSSDEMVFQVKFKKTSFSRTMDYLYAAAVGSTNADSGLVLYFNSNNLYVRIGNSSTNKLSYSGLSLNVFYTLNIHFKNGVFSGTITNENGTTQALTVVSSSAISSLTVSNIGRFGHSVRNVSNLYLKGAIDLNQTFIKVNNTLFHSTVTGSPAQIVAKATNNLYGLVKPDGTTITVNNGVISSNSIRNVGEIIQSSLPLTDAGLHLLDGSLILGGGIYQGFVDYIAELYGDGTNIPSYFCTENEWQTSVTTYGVCGKFVYDSTNNTVRLPKVTGIIEGTTDVNALGDLVEAGLPNITGSFGSVNQYGNTYWNGAFRQGVRNDFNTPTGNGMSPYQVTFDASRSSSIYGNSTTVQPQTIKCFVYIVIANSTKTDIQVDIDEIATDLNNKADTDLTNTTDTAKVMMAGMAMPSDTYIDLTLGANNSTYTAPANGWVKCTIDVNANGWLNIGNHWAQAANISGYVTIEKPVRKNQNFVVAYSGYRNTIDFKFFYAVGSESEAQ